GSFPLSREDNRRCRRRSPAKNLRPPQRCQRAAHLRRARPTELAKIRLSQVLFVWRCGGEDSFEISPKSKHSLSKTEPPLMIVLCACLLYYRHQDFESYTIFSIM